VSISKDEQAAQYLKQCAAEQQLDIDGARIRRTSSRFCLGVEHGDYNGTELFGVGTDRFIWQAFKPNGTGHVRLFSANFPEDGLIEFSADEVPAPRSVTDSWARFPLGVAYILREAGYDLSGGFDGVVYGNIPGGGMSRSASLSLNLILTMLEVNQTPVEDDFAIIDMAQAVENKYIGSPCGQLDQVMIYFAKAGMATRYNPASRSIEYIALGGGAGQFKIVSLDTGTVRPGLEKSTYRIRRAECEQLVDLARRQGYEISCLADVKEQRVFDSLVETFVGDYPDLCRRLGYIYQAQKRFDDMIAAWQAGDIEKVGAIFRADGIGLRDDYDISGPELETMCDIARTVEGVFGERMLGGGDKGASGAIVASDAVGRLRAAVDRAYPRSHPQFAQDYAVHTCDIVDGIKVLENLL